MNITTVRRYDLHYTKAILDFQDEKKKRKKKKKKKIPPRVLQSGLRLFLPIKAGGFLNSVFQWGQDG